MVQDLVHNLCESLMENIDGVAGIGKKTPTPIYLTQWKIVGNSEVHTVPYPDGVVLPNGYKRCEYLTFDGSSYIDTGVTSKSDIEVSIAFLTNTESKCILGARMHSGLPYVCLGIINNTDNTIITGYGGNSITLNTGKQLADGNKHIVTINKTTITIDEDSFILSSTGNFDKNNHNLLGTWLNGENPDLRYFVGNIYDTIFSNTQGELWHGIPCLDANGVPCFYDIVSQTAFYNQGSGSFTYELYPQPTEIWSCGEYNVIDGKYHILVQPQGGSIADIALTEPLRKVNNVTDTIEFPSDTERKALVIRNLKQINMSSLEWHNSARSDTLYRYLGGVRDAYPYAASQIVLTMNTGGYDNTSGNNTWTFNRGKWIGMYPFASGYPFPNFSIYDTNYNKEGDLSAFLTYIADKLIIYRLATPTTELVDAPQIEEAESYTCVISQGGRAVEWSSFSTD